MRIYTRYTPFTPSFLSRQGDIQCTAALRVRYMRDIQAISRALPRYPCMMLWRYPVHRHLHDIIVFAIDSYGMYMYEVYILYHT